MPDGTYNQRRIFPEDSGTGEEDKKKIHQRNKWKTMAMPLSQLFEVLFDSSVVVKYPIF